VVVTTGLLDRLDDAELDAFFEGAVDVCESAGAEYVGGDLDTHQEVTVATTAIGTTETPVLRSTASPGEVVCVTGTLGRSAAAARYFEAGDLERANDRFQFPPRVDAGLALADTATAMMDSSDGLARSLHQLADASDVGFAIDGDRVPVDDALEELCNGADVLHEAMTYGEDFELVATLPDRAVESVRDSLDVDLTVVGRVTDPEDGILLDGEPLADEGWTHGRA
ncbi:MAG: thiamine-phosphate kinase, partial [Halanaeroarchaeum sp.]